MSWKRKLARWLDPQTAKAADRYLFMHHQLDDARWWLGVQHPEVAALAEWIIGRDYWWANSKRLPETNSWAPPAWVTDIGAFRQWLAQKGEKRNK